MAEGAGLRWSFTRWEKPESGIPVRSTTVLFSGTNSQHHAFCGCLRLHARGHRRGRLGRSSRGIGIYSTVTPGIRTGRGYWDLTDVRLTASRPTPFSLNYAMMEGRSFGPDLKEPVSGVQTSLDLAPGRTWVLGSNGTAGQNLGVELPISDAPAIFVRVVTALPLAFSIPAFVLPPWQSLRTRRRPGFTLVNCWWW